MEGPHVLQRSRRHAPKVRSGCVTCKRRRVKCDEQRPTCQRCKTSRIQCEGYVLPKTWIFEPQQQPSTTASPEPRPCSIDDNHCGRKRDPGLKLCPSKDLHYHGTFAGHRGEMQAYQYFAEMTAPIAGQWAARDLWQGILLQAAWVDVAIKDCVVSLTISSMEKAPGKYLSALTGLRSADYYYFRAAGLLGRQHGKSMELSLIASVTFWHFDLFKRRSLRAMIHLHATTRLWRAMRRNTIFSKSLIADVERLLCNLAGIECHPESTDAPHLLPSSEACCTRTEQTRKSGFVSLKAARASLSRCIWAAVLAYDPSATALHMPDRADLEYIVFEKEMNGLLDFSDPPFCTLSDCLSLLASWHRRMCLTSEASVSFIESQSLLLHAQLIRATIEKDVNNGRKENNDREGNDESLFVHVLDDVADILRKSEHHKQSHSAADETVPTNLRSPLCFIKQRAKLQETSVRAVQLMKKAEAMSRGTNNVLLMWMGFICENDLCTGPPVG